MLSGVNIPSSYRDSIEPPGVMLSSHGMFKIDPLVTSQVGGGVCPPPRCMMGCISLLRINRGQIPDVYHYCVKTVLFKP